MRRIALYEDQFSENFSPLTLLRPVFELLCGHYSYRERLTDAFPKVEFGAIVRVELAAAYQSEFPKIHVNRKEWLTAGEVLFVNGRVLVETAVLKKLKSGSAAYVNETLAAVILDPEELDSNGDLPDAARIEELAATKKKVAVQGTVLNYPWDLISNNSKWLTSDFEGRARPVGLSSLNSQLAVVGPIDQLFIDSTARIDPFVVIDTTTGPVWIDRDVSIQAFTRIAGPAFIGAGTQVFRANIREGCSFGPVCRLGGEIEESIFQGYSNKYHDGFLGHSYVCPWVNLGALTSNSDLKNDYSKVSVPLQGLKVESGSTKIGTFIGDHTKTALCSLFNTGSSIGVMSMILPAGELLPKHIPSFSRIWHGQLEELPGGIEDSLKTAKIAMGRRGGQMTPEQEELLRQVYLQTQPERDRAFQRSKKR